jgi:uncharacterized UPF0160 family protein
MKEALKLALEALHGFIPYLPLKDKEQCEKYDKAITAIKAALAQEQEPVAWVDLLKQAEEVVRSKSLWKKYIDGTPLANDIAVWMADFAQQYTTPQQRPWVGLTDDERLEAAGIEGADEWFWKVVEAIEAKLKEKNT